MLPASLTWVDSIKRFSVVLAGWEIVMGNPRLLGAVQGGTPHRVWPTLEDFFQVL